MKTLTLCQKANDGNYYFGSTQNVKGRKIVDQFISAEDLHRLMMQRNDRGEFVYLHPAFNKIIKAEYSRNCTFFYRKDFTRLEFCQKVFEKYAEEI